MANSFYGNNSNLSITFDKIYSSKDTMNKDIDNIYLNRYVFIDGNDLSYPYTVWKKSLINDIETFIQVGKLDLSIFKGLGATLGDYNIDGFDSTSIKISNKSGSIELSGVTDENGITKVFTLNLPEIGNAIAKMWNVVYDENLEDKSRYTNIEFNHDETNRTYNLATLAGCINKIQSLIGREILYIQDDTYPSLDSFKNHYPDRTDEYGFLVYFNKQNNKYYKVTPSEKDSNGKVVSVVSKELSLEFNNIGNTSLYSFLIQIQELYNEYSRIVTEDGGLYVGKLLEGKSVRPEDSEITVVSGEKAEIFNDYRERIYINDFGAFSGNIASGSYSHAEGEITTAATEASHAEGFKTLVSSDINRINNPIESESMEENIWTNMPNGCGGHAEGFNTLISGKAAHAEGKSSLVTGHAAHGEGANSIATGDYSHAEGSHTIASGQAAHAEGNGGKAEGVCSHVEGQGSNAIGYGSHAEGGYTQANNNYSHAEGYSTEAAGESSHAEGAWTIASGNNSHAGGIGTKATGDNQTVIGKYNRPTEDLFVVGNGTGEGDRANAFTIYEDGNIYVNDRLMFQRSNLHDSSKDAVSLIHSGGKALFVTAGVKSGNALSSNDWKVWYTTPEVARENLYFLADENIIFLPGRETLTGETQGVSIWKGRISEKDSIILSPQRSLSGSTQTDSYYTISGHPSYRWSDIYSIKALNISSDIRLKNIQEKVVLDSLLNMYDSITPIAYKLKNLNENDNHDRIHVGLSAQEVEEKLIENKLNRLDFGGLCIDQIYEKDEDGNNTDKIIDEQYSLRYGEFHGLHILKNQQQDARIRELEDKVSNLENELAEIKALLLKNNIS